MKTYKGKKQDLQELKQSERGWDSEGDRGSEGGQGREGGWRWAWRREGRLEREAEAVLRGVKITLRLYNVFSLNLSLLENSVCNQPYDILIGLLPLR